MLKLSLKNLQKNKFRTSLAIISVIISAASLIVFLGLSNGIKNATFEEIEKQNPLTQITVRPKIESTGIISFVTRSEEDKISRQNLEEISKIQNVIAVYPEIQFNNFASIEASLLGYSLITDSMIFGVPQGFIENDLNNPKIWQKTEQPYPAIIPRKILDLYNLAIANPQGLPTISEDSLLGKEITLYPNHSTFFPSSSKTKNQVRLEVVGFSDKVNLVGATLPINIVEELNQNYATPVNTYLELFVETASAAETPKVAAQIEEMGFTTEYFQKNIQEVTDKLNYLSLSLGIISLIIMLTAGIAIISTFLASVAQRTRQIGLYRAIGATKRHIKTILLLEAGIIGIIGSILGILLGILASTFIENIAATQLEQISLPKEALIQISPGLIITVLLFGTLLSLLSAYIPAKQASNIDPIKALSN